MNFIFYVICSFFIISISDFAWAYEVPDYMKDAVIMVKQKNGKMAKYSGNEWGVFKRHDKTHKPKPPSKRDDDICPTCPPPAAPIVVDREVKVIEKTPMKKNNFSLFAGWGPDGRLKHKLVEDTYQVEEHEGVVGSAVYTRIFEHDMWLIPSSASIMGQTNETFSIGLGWNW